MQERIDFQATPPIARDEYERVDERICKRQLIRHAENKIQQLVLISERGLHHDEEQVRDVTDGQAEQDLGRHRTDRVVNHTQRVSISWIFAMHSHDPDGQNVHGVRGDEHCDIEQKRQNTSFRWATQRKTKEMDDGLEERQEEDADHARWEAPFLDEDRVLGQVLHAQIPVVTEQRDDVAGDVLQEHCHDVDGLVHVAIEVLVLEEDVGKHGEEERLNEHADAEVWDGEVEDELHRNVDELMGRDERVDDGRVEGDVEKHDDHIQDEEDVLLSVFQHELAVVVALTNERQVVGGVVRWGDHERWHVVAVLAGHVTPMTFRCVRQWEFVG